jgi:hypothetical protein
MKMKDKRHLLMPKRSKGSIRRFGALPLVIAKWDKQKWLKNKHPPQTWQVQADKV